MKAKSASKEAAKKAFDRNLETARDLIGILTQHVDDRLGIKPDEMDWGAVGCAEELVDALKKAANLSNLLEGE